MEVTALGGGRYLVRDGARQRLAYAVAAGDARWVFLDGDVRVLESPTTSRKRSRHAHDESALASPMPATVVMVTVEPGQQVAQGDVLVMLEAMKMELAVRAPRDGRVKAIACRKGELVQPGVPLVEME
jgi:biotin carboxyl carrier protein